MVGEELAGDARRFQTDRLSPLHAGCNTQNLMVYVDDVDAHCATARAAGAVVVAEPELHDYGDDYWADRAYGCKGPRRPSVVVHAAHPRMNASEEAALGIAMAALGDPTRRAVVRLLARGPRRAGELADELAMTPPTLSRHLRVLRKSGLISDEEPEHDARVRLYRLQPRALQPLHRWLDELEAFWGDQLQAFKAHAEQANRG